MGRGSLLKNINSSVKAMVPESRRQRCLRKKSKIHFNNMPIFTFNNTIFYDEYEDKLNSDDAH